MKKKNAEKIEKDFRKTKRGKTFYRWGIIATSLFFIVIIAEIICGFYIKDYFNLFKELETVILPITIGVDVYYLGALNQYADDYKKKK